MFLTFLLKKINLFETEYEVRHKECVVEMRFVFGIFSNNCTQNKRILGTKLF